MIIDYQQVSTGQLGYSNSVNITKCVIYTMTQKEDINSVKA